MDEAERNTSIAPPRVHYPGAVRPTVWIETLGCPKNQVDSDKLGGRLAAQGYLPALGPDRADLVVVNTCAFVESARQESVDTILSLADVRAPESRLVVTGCLAERFGPELADAVAEVDAVVGFGHDVAHADPEDGVARPDATVRPRRRIPVGAASLPDFDLLNLPRPAASAPWAYVKVAEGCDRACGFCAIPSFRGPQRSRTIDSILGEVDSLGAREIVLVAQDLASFGRDQGVGERSLARLVAEVAAVVDRVRLLYLYPSDLSDGLVDTVLASGVPYFDLSLQHVSAPLLRRMRRWGDGARFMDRIDSIRSKEPAATFRSNFIVGYPGETEDDHDRLLDFIAAVELDWCGFFEYSREDGTYAAGLDGVVDPSLIIERLAEVQELQDSITARKRAAMVGAEVRVLVDAVSKARSCAEAPEIDGIIEVPPTLPVGEFVQVRVVAARGPDLEAVPVEPSMATR